MKGAPAYAAVVLVSAAIIGFVFVAPQLQSGKGPSPSSTFSLQYLRTGGLAGVKDTFLVNNSGLATYNSSFGTSFRVSLAPFEFSHFKQVLSANVGSVQPKTLDAKSGAADYFGYGLTVKLDDQTTQLSWVDEWASSQQFPAELKNIQQTLADTIETLAVRTTYAKMNSSHADLGCGGNKGGLCGALTLTLFADKSTYQSGDEVHAFVTVSNTGAQSFNYTSPTPCDASIRITVAGGNHSLELSAPRTPVACIQVLQPRSVDSNGTIVQNATWDLVFDVNGSWVPAQPGTYVITANFPMARFQTLLEVSLRIVLE